MSAEAERALELQRKADARRSAGIELDLVRARIGACAPRAPSKRAPRAPGGTPSFRLSPLSSGAVPRVGTVSPGTSPSPPAPHLAPSSPPRRLFGLPPTRATVPFSSSRATPRTHPPAADQEAARDDAWRSKTRAAAEAEIVRLSAIEAETVLRAVAPPPGTTELAPFAKWQRPEERRSPFTKWIEGGRARDGGEECDPLVEETCVVPPESCLVAAKRSQIRAGMLVTNMVMKQSPGKAARNPIKLAFTDLSQVV